MAYSHHGEHYSIKKMAHDFNVTYRLLRYYEHIGILKPLHQGRKRLYSSKDRIRLGLTLRARKTGMKLATCTQIYDFYDQPKLEYDKILAYLQLLEHEKNRLQNQADVIATILLEINVASERAKKSVKKQNRIQA
ncbi:MAG: MerR family transcriptional regulator [Pseudomonadota bacterium]